MGLLSDLMDMVNGDASTGLVQGELEQLRQVAEGDGASQMTAIGPKLRRRYRFVGSVQGVGFRWTATNLARSAGATGWVMNEPDGSVTAEIQGVPEQVRAVVDGLDRYYNGRRYLAGFRIDEECDVAVVRGELDFRPIY